jgi:1,2-phenylacetyl-CoA epoxidase PaaB subunit
MHRWEVTLLHRVAAGRRPRVAGRVTLTARDVERAQEMAKQALRERSDGDALWSLGVLRPLTPLAPGTQRYRITFAEWVDEDDAYVRRDVHVMHVWAIDASGARRLAQEDVQRVPHYRGPWRIREVVKVPPPV